MKFTTIATLLLPAGSVLAQRAEFVTVRGFRTEGEARSCAGATVTYTASPNQAPNQIATVSLPNNKVVNGLFSRCNVILDVTFPLGSCITGTVTGRASGHLTIPAGSNVVATFDRTRYSVSPSLITVTRNQVESLNRRGQRDEDYALSDFIDYRYNVNDPNNLVVTFTGQGSGLQLQPSGQAANTVFNNTQFVLDISNQRLCCKSFLFFPWR